MHGMTINHIVSIDHGSRGQKEISEKGWRIELVSNMPCGKSWKQGFFFICRWFQAIWKIRSALASHHPMVEKQTKMKPPANHCLYILYIRPKTGVGKCQNVIKYHKMAPSYWDIISNKYLKLHPNSPSHGTFVLCKSTFPPEFPRCPDHAGQDRSPTKTPTTTLLDPKVRKS